VRVTLRGVRSFTLPLLALGFGTGASPAGAAQEAPRFSFVVAGHIRGARNGDVPARIGELVEEVSRLSPDLVFLTGDMIYGDIESETTDVSAVRADWEALDRVLAGLPCPVERVPGNHDVSDGLTRDIWIERYGALDRAFEFRGSRFLLLCSSWVPEAGQDGRCPPSYIRGRQLTPSQVEFVRREAEGARGAEHVFVLMHHMLWWKDESAWWREVHPLLAAAPTRAVFAGDLGPWKFSHLERDGIDYVQSAVEFTDVPLVMRRNRELSRAISEQLDNFLYVTVDGADVRIEVRTLGGLSTGKFTPSVHREVHEHDKGTLRRKFHDRMSTSDRAVRWLALAAGLGAALGLAGGTLLGLFLRRRTR
jgi:hypothetical protein